LNQWVGLDLGSLLSLHAVDDTVSNPNLSQPRLPADNREPRRDDFSEPEKECPGANRTNTCARVTALIRCGEAFESNESEL